MRWFVALLASSLLASAAVVVGLIAGVGYLLDTP
jgi:ascorbate-specific PTS system EIIC-type component UlaA